MAKVEIPLLFLFSMFLAALPNSLAQMPAQISPSRPLCATQFNMLNYACSMLPLAPLPPATPPPALPPPSPPPSELKHRHGHRHGHRHSQRSRHGHHGTPGQRYCCRWLKQVDTECVCDLLVQLPAFLSRPNHHYTVVVDDTCSITYSCMGRLRP